MNQELTPVSPGHIQDYLAQVQGTNIQWLRENEHRLLQEPPEKCGRYIVIATRASNPVLAIDEDLDEALRIADASDELERIATTEGFDVPLYRTWAILGFGL